MERQSKGIAPGVICRVLPNPIRDLHANKLVQVVEEHQPRRCCLSHHLHDIALTLEFGRCWQVETLQRIAWIPSGRVLIVPERFLQPLHYGEGEDEMLRIVGSPSRRQKPLTLLSGISH
jgi:hypothetical protein